MMVILFPLVRQDGFTNICRSIGVAQANFHLITRNQDVTAKTISPVAVDVELVAFPCHALLTAVVGVCVLFRNLGHFSLLGWRFALLHPMTELYAHKTIMQVFYGHKSKYFYFD